MTTKNSADKLKITWSDLKTACEKAGIDDNDTLDIVYITWGDTKDLTCIKDKDFGWQIVLDCDC